MKCHGLMRLKWRTFFLFVCSARILLAVLWHWRVKNRKNGKMDKSRTERFVLSFSSSFFPLVTSHFCFLTTLTFTPKTVGQGFPRSRHLNFQVPGTDATSLPSTARGTLHILLARQGSETHFRWLASALAEPGVGG